MESKAAAQLCANIKANIDARFTVQTDHNSGNVQELLEALKESGVSGNHQKLTSFEEFDNCE